MGGLASHFACIDEKVCPSYCGQLPILTHRRCILTGCYFTMRGIGTWMSSLSSVPVQLTLRGVVLALENCIGN